MLEYSPIAFDWLVVQSAGAADSAAPTSPEISIILTGLCAILIYLPLAAGWLVYRRSGGAAWVELRPRRAVPWTGLDVAILALAFPFVDLAIFATGLPLVTLLAVTSAFHLLWLALCSVFLWSRCNASAEDLGFEARQLERDLRSGLKVLAAAVLPVFGVQMIATQFWPSKHELIKMTEAEPTAGVLVLATVSALVVAPVFEEFIFRVLLQGWLEKIDIERRASRGLDYARPGPGPLIASSLAFSFVHGWPDMLALFVLALFLGYAYRQTHRIYASLLVHVLINSLAILALWINFLHGQ